MAMALVPGSLSHVAERTGKGIAATFLGAEYVVVIDTSGSMDTHDAAGGQRRFDAAVVELAALQRAHPGQLAVVAFSDYPQFVPGGVPPFLGAGTDLAAALRFVQVCDGTVKSFIVLSDGQPSDPTACLRLARQFKSRIEAVYIGSEVERSGQQFLRELAAAGGGRYEIAARVQSLADRVRLLLVGEERE